MWPRLRCALRPEEPMNPRAARSLAAVSCLACAVPTGETPVAPVYVDGQKTVTLKGERIAEEFQDIVEQYVARSYPRVSGP